MEPQHDDGVTLSAFDQRTATAVVSVLRRAGVAAWLAPGGHDEDVEVLVPDGHREVAMRELGTRMEEVREAVQSTRPPDDRPAGRDDRAARPLAPSPDPDDVHAGPPLVMERFRSMRILAAVVMAPLLVVTLAPTLRGSTARVVLVVLATVAAGVVLAFRRRR